MAAPIIISCYSYSTRWDSQRIRHRRDRLQLQSLILAELINNCSTELGPFSRQAKKPKHRVFERDIPQTGRPSTYPFPENDITCICLWFRQLHGKIGLELFWGKSHFRCIKACFRSSFCSHFRLECSGCGTCQATFC